MEDNQNQNDENQGSETPNEDLLNNFKQEVNRKNENMSSQIDQLAQSQKQILDAISGLSQKGQSGESLEDGDEYDFFSDPNKATEKIASKVTEKVMGTINKSNQAQEEVQRKQQEVIGELVSNFPELNDGSSDMYKRTVDHFNKMPDAQRKDPISYKIAAQQAAIELGVKPLSQRGDSGEFAFGSNSGGKRSKSNKIEPETLAFAQLMGKNINDSKYLERLKKASKRNFKKYE
jgi:hypothetical protein